jgi:hypothetical protein
MGNNKIRLKNIYGFKSSFGNPTVLIKDTSKILFVQDFKVAEAFFDPHIAKIHAMYTFSMYRSIKEFLLQEGFKAESIEQMDKDYIKKKVKRKYYENNKKKK